MSCLRAFSQRFLPHPRGSQTVSTNICSALAAGRHPDGPAVRATQLQGKPAHPDGVVRCRAQTLLVLFSVDDLTGFELTHIMELPDPWGLVAVWGLVLPVAYLVSSALTNLVLRDFLILKARRAQHPP